MLDLQKIYEKSAYKLAADLQSYIGANMVMTKFDFSKGKSKSARRNPETGTGTLRVITGNLYRSFTPKKISQGNIYRLDVSGNNFTFTYGSSVKYAAIHEFGGTAGNGANIPARPYFKPAIEEWKKNKLFKFQSEIKLEIIKEMKTWLGNQKQLKK
jgi:phage gpG-like protein